MQHVSEVRRGHLTRPYSIKKRASHDLTSDIVTVDYNIYVYRLSSIVTLVHFQFREIRLNVIHLPYIHPTAKHSHKQSHNKQMPDAP